MAIESEQGNAVHQEMFQTLFRTPHRQGDETLVLHIEQFERDPNFYGKLAVHAVHLGNQVIRDVNEIFLAVLFNSPYEEHRAAAYVMMQALPPYQVVRVCNYFTGYNETVKHASYEPALPTNNRFGLSYKRATAKNGTEIPRKTITMGKNSKLRQRLVEKGKLPARASKFTVDTWLFKHKGLNHRRFKGLLKQSVRAYLRLREREENRGQMEGALLRGREVIRRLYAKSNLCPQSNEASWINQYVFHGIAEEGSRLGAVRRLQQTNDPSEQSAIIMDAKLPYTLASSVISDMSPSVLVALIDAMSPQELMQSLGSLQKRGAMDNADLKRLIDNKLKKAKKAKKTRVDALKGAKAAEMVVGLDADIKKSVIAVTDAQLKKHGEIKASTVLMIDKSGSMAEGIELGKQLGAAIGQAIANPDLLRAFLFDRMPVPIVWSEADGDVSKKSSWDTKLKMYRAVGGTSPNSVVRAMIDQKIHAEQIVVVTDEGENSPGQFAQAVKNYEREMGILPSVVLVRVGHWRDVMYRTCEAAGIDVDFIDCSRADSVSIPNVIQLLSRKSIFDLVMEILALPLPDREQWDKKNGLTPGEIKRGQRVPA